MHYFTFIKGVKVQGAKISTLFHEFWSHTKFQPFVCIFLSFVKQLQSGFKFCQTTNRQGNKHMCIHIYCGKSAVCILRIHSLEWNNAEWNVKYSTVNVAWNHILYEINKLFSASVFRKIHTADFPHSAFYTYPPPQKHSLPSTSHSETFVPRQ